MRYFTAQLRASILAGLAGLALTVSAASAQETKLLTLRPPYAHFKAQSANGYHYRIDGVRADASGGMVRVTFIGHDQCEGHVQRADFKWTILPNVASLAVTDGRQAFTVYLAIDGDYDSCMQVNPMFVVNQSSGALQRSPGGEGRFYEYQHPFHVPDPRVFTYHTGPGQDNAGFSIDIALPSLPQHGGDQYAVEYRFNVSSGAAPVPSFSLIDTFDYPTIGGMRIDRCLRWAAGCDRDAADAFCRAKGYFAAQDWKWEYTAPTRTLGDGQICRDPRACGGFSQIRCVRSPSR